MKKQISKNWHVFFENKFAVEIDEKGHIDRNQNEANERQAKIEKHSDSKSFYRINLDAGGFDNCFEISKIQGYIAQSNQEKLKKEKEAENKRTKRKTKKTRISNKRTKKQKKQKKELKMKNIQNSATNQITNNFGKITIKNWQCKTWKAHNQK